MGTTPFPSLLKMEVLVEHTRTAVRTLAVALMAVGLLALPAVAQKPSPRLGLMAGATFATVSVEDAGSTEFKNRTGFMGGGFAEIPVSNVVSIQPELLYAMKGTKLEDGSETGEIKLSYFEIPVLLRVNIPTEGGTVRPHLYAGPAIGFKVACDFEFEGTSASCEDEEITLKSSDWSAVFGGGIDIKQFTIGIRYTLGLANIEDSANGSDDSAKNRALSIYAGFGFTLNK